MVPSKKPQKQSTSFATQEQIQRSHQLIREIQRSMKELGETIEISRKTRKRLHDERRKLTKTEKYPT